MRAARMVTLALGMALGMALGLPVRAGAPRGPGEGRDVQVAAQAGVFAYTGAAAALTGPGAIYGFTVGVEVMPLLALEAGLLGAVARTGARGRSGRASLLESGGQLLVQLGPELGAVRPFAVGGVALSRLALVEEEAPEERGDRATLLRLPVGVGLELQLPSSEVGDLTLGVRGTLHATVAGAALPLLEDAGAASQVAGVLSVGGSW